MTRLAARVKLSARSALGRPGSEISSSADTVTTMLEILLPNPTLTRALARWGLAALLAIGAPSLAADEPEGLRILRNRPSR